jgi:NAD(P)H-nitrite reductase large subunit
MNQLSKQKKVNVIIGNSAAGVSAIKAIRKYDSQCSIILISKEDCIAYSPVLTTYYIAQQIDKSGMFIVNDSFFKDYNVTPYLGTKAVEVDPDAGLVKLENGKNIEFDNLLIATGSSPKRLGLEGEDLPGIYTLKSMSDAERILKHSAHAKDIVVIGGGLISLQATKALNRADRNLTMLISSNQLLSRNVDEKCSSLLEDTIKRAGVSILYKKNVKGFCRKGNRLMVGLDSDESLDADMIVIGKGVNPNIDLVQNSQIATNRGIVVDESMRTNLPNIYAAGDVAEGPNILSGKNAIVANWINACEQGITAGTNMAGGSLTYHNLGENVTNIFGLIIAVLGNSKSADETDNNSSNFDFNKGIYRKLHFNEKDELDGAILVGQALDAGIISSLIRKRVKVPTVLREQIVCNAKILSAWDYIRISSYEPQ